MTSGMHSQLDSFLFIAQTAESWQDAIAGTKTYAQQQDVAQQASAACGLAWDTAFTAGGPAAHWNKP